MVVGLKQHWTVASFAVVLIVAGCFFALNTGKGKSEKSSSPDERTGETASGTSTSNGNRSDNTSSGNVPKMEDDPEMDDSESLATLTEMPQFGVIEPSVQDISQVTMPSVSSAVLAGRDRTKLESAEPVDAERRSTKATHSDREGSESRDVTEAALASEMTERDVMQELETLTKSAANNAVETDIAAPDTEDSNTVFEPLLLRTSPMLQTQKLAAKIKVRPRQPVWQILLSVDAEFELTPVEFQNISDRQITTWMLSDSDSNSPKVRLVIQAQAAPGRQTSLRWRIFVGSEDLPDLMLPLDKEVLQPLQERLRVYAPLAQREADRLKQLASVAEREVRAALTKQRARMESQSKLASRLSTIVAEAQLLDDLLRSQLTIYAKLRDGTDPNAATLLQFGDVRELEAKDEQSKPPVTAE